MSSFTAPLRLEFDWAGDKKKPFVVFEAFTYRTGEAQDKWVTVPIGFRTDFASIPFGFRNIFSPTGCYGKAAVLHDYLYSGGWVHEFMVDPRTRTTYEMKSFLNRKEADEIFLEAMCVLGVGKWTRRIVYAAVRVFGCFAYAR